MMTKNQINEREQLEILTMEQLAPSNHLVRKLDATIDFSFIYPIVEPESTTDFESGYQMLPILPYTRPKTKDGFFRKHRYVYDEHYDSYICPNDQMLRCVTTKKEGYRQYKSNPTVYANCHFLTDVQKVKSILN